MVAFLRSASNHRHLEPLVDYRSLCRLLSRVLTSEKDTILPQHNEVSINISIWATANLSKVSNKQRTFVSCWSKIGPVYGGFFFYRAYFSYKTSHSSPKITHLLLSTCIRPVLEYCAPLYNHALSANLSEDLEHIQKSALSVIRISPGLSYHVILELYNIRSLKGRRKEQCSKLFDSVVSGYCA